MASQDGDILTDLECGGTTSEEDGSRESVSGSSRGRKTLSRARSGALNYYNGSISGGDSDTDSSDNGRRVELLIERSTGTEECVALLDNKRTHPNNDQRKKVNLNLKKPSKPPRPPKGPLLNASDLKLVRELSELAARKRARIERMKQLRKMKESKRPSSSSSVTAMVITALFFLIILFQGVFSRSNVSREFPGSPAPAVTSGSMISIQLFNNAPTNEMNRPVSLSLNSVEQASGSIPQEEEGRDVE